MRRVAALLVLAALGGGSGAVATPAPRVSAPRLVQLQPNGGSPPAQGLLAVNGKSIVLLGLDGRRYAQLVGARPWWASPDTARTAAFKELAQSLPDHTFVIGPDGRWYVFDSPARIRPLATARLRLAGDIEVAAHARPTDDGAFDVDVTVERAGRQLVPASAGLQLISGELAVTRSAVLDLRNGDRWKLSSNCLAAGAENHRLLMLCDRLSGRGSVVALSPTGSPRTLAHVPHSLYPSAGFVSPNGKYVVGVFSPGCGDSSYSFVAPTSGGTARLVSGETKWSSEVASSTVLGWTTDNRIVAVIGQTGSFASERKSVFTIDPQTLSRTFVSAGAWVMANPAHG